MQRKLNFIPTKSNFKLGDKLGSGTVGIVYQATSPDLSTPVAVKLLNPSVSDEPAIVDRFEREIVVMERLNHPHIVKNYGGGQIDGQLFYAMQLLKHGSLKDRLRRGPLPWPKVAAYGAQIASALQHAHNHGIVHRDLKPSNLFFDDKGDLVLGDFGIARDLHASADITNQGMTVGTFSYMSPEQITADSQISGAADLYSLGCVLFEMLTGELPFRGANFAQVWEQHLRRDPPSIREVQKESHALELCPEWLDDLVCQLMAKGPMDRPFNARAVQSTILGHMYDEFGEEETKKLTRMTEEDWASLEQEDKPKLWVLWVALAAAAALVAWTASRG